MSFQSWLRGVFAPAQLMSGEAIAIDKPLYEQFQRIGGGLTPSDVQGIIAEADSGQPARLVDLANESREKDGHLLGVCGTRDRSVALFDLEFAEPEDATPKEIEAGKMCRRIRDEFRNWPVLVEHHGGSYYHGHSTSETKWVKAKDGLLLPSEAKPIHARQFIFAQADGKLRYARYQGDTTGVDILADNPGRIVQLQRRIVGDVQVREGMARFLCWAALFRNWDLRDLIALGEIGWKPWRIAKYAANTHKDEIARLLRMVERIGSTGAGVIPDTMSLDVKWPGGSGNSIGTAHIQLFELLGREMSKAVLGQTTTTESGPNGDQRGSETRDKVRGDIREQDCRAIASALYWHMFLPAVAVNYGEDVRCPVPYFQTDEGTDQVAFSQMVKELRLAGVAIPAKWVRESVGMPEPVEDEELVDENASKAEDIRTLAFASRAWRTGGYRIKNLDAIADEYEIELVDDDLLLGADGGGDAPAAE